MVAGVEPRPIPRSWFARCWRRASTVTCSSDRQPQVIKAYVDKKNRQGVKWRVNRPRVWKLDGFGAAGFESCKADGCH